MKEDFDYQAMLAGQLYQAAGILPENSSAEGKKKTGPGNQPFYQSMTEKESSPKKKYSLANLGSIAFVQPPLFVDYGRHVEIGDHFYANMDCIFFRCQ